MKLTQLKTLRGIFAIGVFTFALTSTSSALQGAVGTSSSAGQEVPIPDENGDCPIIFKLAAQHAFAPAPVVSEVPIPDENGDCPIIFKFAGTQSPAVSEVPIPDENGDCPIIFKMVSTQQPAVNEVPIPDENGDCPIIFKLAASR